MAIFQVSQVVDGTMFFPQLFEENLWGKMVQVFISWLPFLSNTEIDEKYSNQTMENWPRSLSTRVQTKQHIFSTKA